jgi:Periplasmic binding protein-like domain
MSEKRRAASRNDGDGCHPHSATTQERIPDDVSVVGVDDLRYARYTDPPLTNVAQPMR